MEDGKAKADIKKKSSGSGIKSVMAVAKAKKRMAKKDNLVTKQHHFKRVSIFHLYGTQDVPTAADAEASSNNSKGTKRAGSFKLIQASNRNTKRKGQTEHEAFDPSMEQQKEQHQEVPQKPVTHFDDFMLCCSFVPNKAVATEKASDRPVTSTTSTSTKSEQLQKAMKDLFLNTELSSNAAKREAERLLEELDKALAEEGKVGVEKYRIWSISHCEKASFCQFKAKFKMGKRNRAAAEEKASAKKSEETW